MATFLQGGIQTEEKWKFEQYKNIIVYILTENILIKIETILVLEEQLH